MVDNPFEKFLDLYRALYLKGDSTIGEHCPLPDLLSFVEAQVWDQQAQV